MKVKIKYTLTVEKEIEISCEDYCYAHANHKYLSEDIIPKDAKNVDIDPATYKDEMALAKYLCNKKIKNT